MEQNTTTPSNPEAGKNLGIAGLIVGIISAIFSFVPCLGMWAIIPAIVGIILSAISMKQAGPGGSKGMAIGGLVTSIIGLLIAAYWLYATIFIANAAVNGMNELEKAGGLDSLSKAFQQAGDSINKAMEQLKEITDTTGKK
jgi:hypothetical protein